MTVKSRFCYSGTGRVVWASRFSLLLALTKVEPEAAVRAWRDKAADTEDKAELKRAGSEGWNPIPLQHGQNARHQPEGRGRHL